jgi:hypothetical protein
MISQSSLFSLLLLLLLLVRSAGDGVLSAARYNGAIDLRYTSGGSGHEARSARASAGETEEPADETTAKQCQQHPPSTIQHSRLWISCAFNATYTLTPANVSPTAFSAQKANVICLDTGEQTPSVEFAMAREASHSSLLCLSRPIIADRTAKATTTMLVHPHQSPITNPHSSPSRQSPFDSRVRHRIRRTAWLGLLDNVHVLASLALLDDARCTHVGALDVLLVRRVKARRQP